MAGEKRKQGKERGLLRLNPWIPNEFIQDGKAEEDVEDDDEDNQEV